MHQALVKGLTVLQPEKKVQKKHKNNFLHVYCITLYVLWKSKWNHYKSS